MVATVAEAEAVGVGMVDAEDGMDGMDALDTVNMVEIVDPETVTKVSAPIAKLTAILQMHAESATVRRREEMTEMMSEFGSSAGSQAM